MISWHISLSANQIRTLKSLRLRKLGDEMTPESLAVPHFLCGTHVLEREGLVEYRHEKTADGRYMDSKRSGHFITPRGLLILGLIEEDMERFLKDSTPRPKEVKPAKSARKAQ